MPGLSSGWPRWRTFLVRLSPTDSRGSWDSLRRLISRRFALPMLPAVCSTPTIPSAQWRSRWATTQRLLSAAPSASGTACPQHAGHDRRSRCRHLHRARDQIQPQKRMHPDIALSLPSDLQSGTSLNLIDELPVEPSVLMEISVHLDSAGGVQPTRLDRVEAGSRDEPLDHCFCLVIVSGVEEYSPLGRPVRPVLQPFGTESAEGLHEVSARGDEASY